MRAQATPEYRDARKPCRYCAAGALLVNGSSVALCPACVAVPCRGSGCVLSDLMLPRPSQNARYTARLR
eukprot:3522151-Prymnesium_polylepis.1